MNSHTVATKNASVQKKMVTKKLIRARAVRVKTIVDGDAAPSRLARRNDPGRTRRSRSVDGIFER